MHSETIACSQCFSDFGLRRTAEGYGEKDLRPCPRCNAINGRKLNHGELEKVCHEYFVLGSTKTGRGNFAPLVQFNPFRNEFDALGTPVLNSDLAKLRDLGFTCFLYGPPLWRFGKTPEEDGQVVWTQADLDYVIDACPEVGISTNIPIYRVQLDIDESSIAPPRFCSPPQQFRIRLGRFDSFELPIWYGAFDVETCLHESRVTLQHEISVAVCAPSRPLRLIDLSHCELDVPTPFEDPAIWLLALIYNGEESYGTCRRLAKEIASRGFDGFLYTSFFQQAASRNHTNVALFNRPIVEGLLNVVSLNVARVRNVAYDWQFGPQVFSAYEPSDGMP